MTDPMLWRRPYGDVELDGERFLALLPDGPALRLIGSGAVIWDCLTDGATPEAVVARVAETVGLPATDIRADVTDFLDDLVRTGLLEVT